MYWLTILIGTVGIWLILVGLEDRLQDRDWRTGRMSDD